MADQAPPWLMVMRAITGMTEDQGSGDNPRIMHMSDAIAREYPHQKEYCNLYTGDDVAWCGLTVGYCVTLAGIEPVYGDTDTERWMWALAWSEWPEAEKLDEPVLGCIVSMEREGGGHVCLYEGPGSSGKFMGRGGNQSDAVTLSEQSLGNVVAFMWPKGHKIPRRQTDPENEAFWLQSSLNIAMPQMEPKLDVDGDIGPATEGAVMDYQKAHNLSPTGDADKKTVTEILMDLDKWNKFRPRGSLG